MSSRSNPRAVVITLLRRLNLLDAYFRSRRRVRRGRDRALERMGPPHALRSFRARDDVVVGRWFDGWSVAVKVDRLDAQQARRSNLTTVLSLLDGVGAKYWYVPTVDDRACRIGVDQSSRAQLVARIQDVGFDHPTYVRPAGRSVRGLHPIASTDTTRGPTKALAEANIWFLWVQYTEPSGRGAFGREAAVQIEFWQPTNSPSGEPESPRPDTATTTEDDRPGVEGSNDETTSPPYFRASRSNPLARVLEASAVDESTIEIGDQKVPAPVDFARYHESRQVSFPVDLVYTWVDDGDPAWQQRRDAARGGARPPGGSDGDILARFRNHNELLYSLRSAALHASFVRRIFLVTAGQRPDWLDETGTKLTVVDHRDIFRPDDVLPTFNSHAIESRLHRIDGLCEHYIYVNDDVFFGRPVSAATFFTPAGRSLYFPSKARVPAGASDPVEPTVTSAARNGRDLLFDAFRAFPLQKMKHTPHPQRRSTVLDMESRYPEAMAAVGRNQFRCATDISVASWLQHYHGAAIGQAEVGSIRYDYLNLASGNLPDRLKGLVTGNFDTWCLNDTEVGPSDDYSAAVLLKFLERAFPWPAPWERATSTHSSMSR